MPAIVRDVAERDRYIMNPVEDVANVARCQPRCVEAYAPGLRVAVTPPAPGTVTWETRSDLDSPRGVAFSLGPR